jgi:ATP-dependent Clp protease ATP-binding subunit ClpC
MKEQQAENIVNVEASPEIELSSLTDVNRIESSLKENLIGQEEVIKNIVSTLKLMATGLSTHTSFYFAGQPGCGKSHCAKILGKQLKNFYQINCGEYSNGGEYTKLIGSPPGYIGHTENTVLGQKAAISNRWVLLFDEFEKANEKFQEFLLNLLDEGKVTDNLGQTLDFSKSVFIFTSNQGLKDTVGVKKIGLGEKISTYVSSKESILEDIKKHLSPEFLDRIDNMVFFNPLTKDNIEKIIKLELNNYPIISSKKLTDFIINNAYTPE